MRHKFNVLVAAATTATLVACDNNSETATSAVETQPETTITETVRTPSEPPAVTEAAPQDSEQSTLKSATIRLPILNTSMILNGKPGIMPVCEDGKPTENSSKAADSYCEGTQEIDELRSERDDKIEAAFDAAWDQAEKDFDAAWDQAEKDLDATIDNIDDDLSYAEKSELRTAAYSAKRDAQSAASSNKRDAQSAASSAKYDAKNVITEENLSKLAGLQANYFETIAGDDGILTVAIAPTNNIIDSGSPLADLTIPLENLKNDHLERPFVPTCYGAKPASSETATAQATSFCESKHAAETTAKVAKEATKELFKEEEATAKTQYSEAVAEIPADTPYNEEQLAKGRAKITRDAAIDNAKLDQNHTESLIEEQKGEDISVAQDEYIRSVANDDGVALYQVTFEVD